MSNNYFLLSLRKLCYRTLGLAVLGSALEFYDFIIFVFLAPIMSEVFFPATQPAWLRLLQTFIILAVGYLIRPIGGFFIAHFGDRLGRKKMFTFSVMLMALPTLVMGLLPTYTSIGVAAPLLLLLMRLLQGAAVGGEVPGAWVFVAEHISPKRTGLACGILTAGLSGGILLGSLVVMFLNMALSEQNILNGGWRIPFLFGGSAGLVTMFLRRWLQETPVFICMQARMQMLTRPLKFVLLNHRQSVCVSILLTWLLSAGVIVVVLMTPTWLQQVSSLAPRLALQANSIAIVAMVVGCVITGLSTDRFGADITLIVGSFLLASCCWLFYWSVEAHPSWLVICYALAGFSVGIVGVVPYVMVRSFPVEVRFSGVSFSYNIAYAFFGGITPLIVMSLIHINPLAPAYYISFLSCIGVLVGIFLKTDKAHNFY